MKENRDESPRRIETVEAPISTLCAAILRINASLDLETVLREIVDSARALTGARYGLIVTVDDAGRPRDFVTTGLAPDVPPKMTEWSDGPRLFEHFRDLPEPLRVADLPSYVRELGFSPKLMVVNAMQCTPMRHRGSHVGNFFLGDKEGGSEFTAADEEILVLFASQAATAIVNARTHEAERRARADLETLVETSPVGVVVFDGATGKPVSVNREARRIVERLRLPNGSLEELLDEVTCRRGDGRPEIALSELPMAQQLSSAEPVRARRGVTSRGMRCTKPPASSSPAATSWRWPSRSRACAIRSAPARRRTAGGSRSRAPSAARTRASPGRPCRAASPASSRKWASSRA